MRSMRMPINTPVTVPKFRPRPQLPMTPVRGVSAPATPRKQLFPHQQSPIQTPVQITDLSRVKKEPIDIPRFNLEPDLIDQKPSFPTQTSFIHPTFQSSQKPQIPQATVQDLKGDPWLDPRAEPPLEESAVDAQFRHPMQEDFIIPPTLAEATKNKTLLAKRLTQTN